METGRRGDPGSGTRPHRSLSESRRGERRGATRRPAKTCLRNPCLQRRGRDAVRADHDKACELSARNLPGRRVVSAPKVNGPISGGNGVIEGVPLDEAKTLKVQLNAGALPVPLHTIQTSEVDATLGETTLVRSVQAGMIGILAVMVFMILYYRLPGVLASLALVTYISSPMMIFS